IELSTRPTIFVNRKHPTVEQFQKVISGKSAFIDLDIKIKKKIIQKVATEKGRMKLILSHHNYEKTPSQKMLERIIGQIFALGADIAKIATQIKKEEDERVLLAVLKKYKTLKKKIIIHGMSEKSQKSRLECYKSGSEIAYVALSKNSRTAPGQLTIDEWRKV
ncbi:MAG: type I 3-dehydroquinate dehydratase, partial [Patescibacteria group bacterium]